MSAATLADVDGQINRIGMMRQVLEKSDEAVSEKRLRIGMELIRLREMHTEAGIKEPWQKWRGQDLNLPSIGEQNKCLRIAKDPELAKTLNAKNATAQAAHRERAKAKQDAYVRAAAPSPFDRPVGGGNSTPAGIVEQAMRIVRSMTHDQLTSFAVAFDTHMDAVCAGARS